MSAAPVSEDRRPVVGLVARPGTTAAARPLVAALARRATVRASGRAPEADALLLTHPAAGGPAPGRPTAVVDGDLVLVRAADGSALGQPLVRPGPDVVATAALPPVAPHVRRRWRERLGLDPDLVVDTLALDPLDVPTALAVAAAAVVERRDLPVALALGCPTVTDASAAAAVGAEPGRDLEVGDRAVAVALAADEARAAALSRRGRALAERRLDPEVTAAALLDRWGLGPRPTPLRRLEAALEDLGTAPGAPVRARARAATDLFAPTPTAPGAP
ncbi:hypothetical protein PO878_13455 [Iamia majanohamensis]|uniref:Uncharacterized protein n=1 Tax=Iamia majanohamensis TaxID=467976 RepID=A0AAE9Y732_9ACTN|nr:hypothetical protein [Iamia majanohamensis]WCO65504.1 hypothetical protein PO878_13455 [Iamia majanohamensis]